MTDKPSTSSIQSACSYYSGLEWSQELVSTNSSVISDLLKDQFFNASRLQTLICQAPQISWSATPWNKLSSFKFSAADADPPSSSLSLLIYLKPDQTIPVDPKHIFKTTKQPVLYIDSTLEGDSQNKFISLEKVVANINHGAFLFSWIPSWLFDIFKNPRASFSVQKGRLILQDHFSNLLDFKIDVTDEILPRLPKGLQKEGGLPINEILDWIGNLSSSSDKSFPLESLISSLWANIRLGPIDLHRKNFSIVFNQNLAANDIPLSFEIDPTDGIRFLKGNGSIDLKKLSISNLLNLGETSFDFQANANFEGPTDISLRNIKIYLELFNYFGLRGKIRSPNPFLIDSILHPGGVTIDGKGLKELNLKVNLDFNLQATLPWIGEVSFQGTLLFNSLIKKIPGTLFSYQIVPETISLSIPQLQIEWGDKNNPQKIRGELSFAAISSPLNSDKKTHYELNFKIKENQTDQDFFTKGALSFLFPIPQTQSRFFALDTFKKNPQATGKFSFERPNQNQFKGEFKLESTQQSSKWESELAISINETDRRGKAINPFIQNGKVSFASKRDLIHYLDQNSLILQATSFLGIANPNLQLRYSEKEKRDGTKEWRVQEFQLAGNQEGSVVNPLLHGPFSLRANILPEQKPQISYHPKTGEIKIEHVDIALNFEKIYPPRLLEETQGRIKGFDVNNLHWIADGIFNVQTSRWEGDLSFKGSKSGDLFPLDKEGNRFEARLDPEHPERFYAIPLLRNSIANVSSILEEYPYWWHGGFLLDSHVELIPLLNQRTDTFLKHFKPGRFKFKFHDLPKPTKIPEAFYALFQRTLDRLSELTKKENIAPVEEVKVESPIEIPRKTYANSWWELLTKSNCLPKVRGVKGALRGIVANGGKAGCRWPEFIRKELLGKVPCNVIFEENTKGDLLAEAVADFPFPNERIPVFLQSGRARVNNLQLIYRPNVTIFNLPAVRGFFLYNIFTNPCGPELCGSSLEGFETPTNSLRRSFTAPLRPLSMEDQALRFRFVALPLHHTIKLPLGKTASIYDFTPDYLEQFDLTDPKLYEKYGIPLYTIPPYMDQDIELFGHGTLPKNIEPSKRRVINPNDGIKPDLLNFLDFEEAELEADFDACKIAFPNIGKIEFSRASAIEEYQRTLRELDQIKIDRKEPELSLTRLLTWIEQKKGSSKYQKLLQRLKELEANTFHLQAHSNARETVFTFSNVELPEIEFSNRNYLLKAKRIQAKKVEVTFPYSFPHLVKIIRKGEFDWTELGIKIEGESPNSGATVEEVTYTQSTGFTFHLQKEESEAKVIQLKFDQFYNRETKKTDQDGEILINGKLKDLTFAQGKSFKVQFATSTPQDGKISFHTPLNRKNGNSSEIYALPIFDITGDLGLQAGSFGISKESFNLPGLEAGGSIQDIHFRGKLHVQSTGNSLILENASPQEKREKFGLFGTLKEVVVDLNHLLTAESEKLKKWRGGDLVRSHLALTGERIEIGDLRKLELRIIPQISHGQKPTYSFNIHEVEAYDLAIRHITAKRNRLWKSIIGWEYLMGYFPEIGALAESLAQLIDPKSSGPKESFFKLGAILMCNKDGRGICKESLSQTISETRRKNYDKPITDLRELETELYGIGDNQHLILRTPQLLITPEGERVLTLPDNSLYIKTYMKDDIRRGEIYYETIERDLEGLPYRIVPLSK